MLEVRRVKTILCVGLTMAGLLAVGCARKLPQEVSEVNRQLAQAKDDCAGVYAVDALAGVTTDAEAMNSLAEARKFKKARRSAEPLLPKVAAVQKTASDARAAAKTAAEAAVSQLAAAVKAAEDEGAATHAATQHGTATKALAEARAKLKDPCAYLQARSVAEGAMGGARDARTAALAAKKRIEEERRLAEERRKREEEEAAALKRAEEERLRRFPPTYTVVRGDSLWNISAKQSIYGRPLFWPILHDANSSKIRNPDLIHPGQELSIPRGDASAMEARLRELWRKYGRGN